jgi:hypothetical protein
LSNIGIFTHPISELNCGSCGCWPARRKLFGEISTLTDLLAGRLLVLLIPVGGVAYRLLRLLPALYDWSMRRRVFRLYGELKFIEFELEFAFVASLQSPSFTRITG